MGCVFVDRSRFDLFELPEQSQTYDSFTVVGSAESRPAGCSPVRRGIRSTCETVAGHRAGQNVYTYNPNQLNDSGGAQ